MIRLLLTLFQIPLFAIFALSTAYASEPKLPPAPVIQQTAAAATFGGENWRGNVKCDGVSRARFQFTVRQGRFSYSDNRVSMEGKLDADRYEIQGRYFSGPEFSFSGTKSGDAINDSSAGFFSATCYVNLFRRSTPQEQLAEGAVKAQSLTSSDDAKTSAAEIEALRRKYQRMVEEEERQKNLAPPVSQAAADSAMWNEIKYSTDIGDFQRYLEKFSNGVFVSLAEQQMRNLVSLAARADGSGETKDDPFAGIHFGNYHALVIGNNRYPGFRDLKTAVPDARAVAETLRRDYGFNVDLRINAKRYDIISGLVKMRAKLTENDHLLVYYAGHGVIDGVTEQGYWLPVDAEEGIPANWISTSDITNMLAGMRARHVMVVADSCYSGTLVRAASGRIKTGREKVAWVKRMLGKRARTALVSGGLEPVRDSGGGDHSVFAKAFLEALQENRDVMGGQALFDAIKRPVVLDSDQTPQYSDIRKAGHEGGEFMFVRKGS